MDLSVIIVSYNTFDLTKDAVQSVLDDSTDINLEIIVVDNNSPDMSAKKLLSHFPPESHSNVKIIPLNENRGFSGGNNLGAKHSTGRVLFFLNPDTVVLPNSLSKIVSACKPRSTGAVGPRVFNSDHTDQKSISSFPTVRSLTSHYLPISALWQPGIRQSVIVPDDQASVDEIKGCAIAMRRDVFDHVGGWDETYFLYAEESELCYQIKRLGYTNRFIREAEIIHYGQASTSKENFATQQVIQGRSTLQFLRRHSPTYLVYLNRLLGILGFAIRYLIFTVMGWINGKDLYSRRADAARHLVNFFAFDYKLQTTGHKN